MSQQEVSRLIGLAENLTTPSYSNGALDTANAQSVIAYSLLAIAKLLDRLTNGGDNVPVDAHVSEGGL